jgi:hypothetical protein
MTEDKSFVLEYYIPDHPSVAEDKANAVPDDPRLDFEAQVKWETAIKNHYLKLRNGDRFKDFSPDVQQEIIDWLNKAEEVDQKVRAEYDR